MAFCDAPESITIADAAGPEWRDIERAMNLDSRKSRGLQCVLSLLMLAQAALSGWSWGIAIWGVAALVWSIRFFRFDRESRVARHAVPNRRSHAMPWWAWVWAGTIVLLTALGASEEWNTGLPIRALLDGAVGGWCLVSLRAHFVRSMADRLGRVLLPVSLLAGAWFLAACVVDYGTLPLAPELSLFATVVIVILAAIVDTLVMGWPLVLGIRNGLEYWSPGNL